MALVFGDSFDHYLIADILKKWTSIENSSDFDISPAYALPPHGLGLRLNSNRRLWKTLPANLQVFVVGGWFRFVSTAASHVLFYCYDSGNPSTIHVSVRTDGSSRLTFCRDATVLATSTNAFSVGVWYHIEAKVTIGDAGDTPSGRYEVRVDGSSTNWVPDSGTGKDTRNGGNQNIGSFALSAVGAWINDVYILNTTGAVASDFLGPCRFQVLRPIGVGTTAEWVGNYADNWQNVSDLQGDSDATFNQSGTSGQTDQFVMSRVPAGTVHAIQHVLMARKDAGVARVVRPITRIGTTDYNGTSFSMAGGHAFYCDPASVSPATSNQWSDTELNALEGGYELV